VTGARRARCRSLRRRRATGAPVRCATARPGRTAWPSRCSGTARAGCECSGTRRAASPRRAAPRRSSAGKPGRVPACAARRGRQRRWQRSREQRPVGALGLGLRLPDAVEGHVVAVIGEVGHVGRGIRPTPRRERAVDDLTDLLLVLRGGRLRLAHSPSLGSAPRRCWHGSRAVRGLGLDQWSCFQARARDPSAAQW
jgi:hypothetical protein